MTNDFVNYANVDDFYVNMFPLRNINRIGLRKGKMTFLTQRVWKEKFMLEILVVQRYY